MQHTRAPWKLDAFNSVYSGKPLSWDLIDANGETIATIDRPTEKEVGPYLSNALAIAAAPELLASLKELFGMVENQELVRDIRNDGQPDFALRMLNFVPKLHRAMKAIEKAEGKL